MAGFPKVPLDADFPAAFVSDIRHVIRQMVDVHKARVRVIRVPYERLAPVFDTVVARMQMPFMPTLCGFPVEFVDPAQFENSDEMKASEVQVMCVHDDDTLLAVNQRGQQNDGQRVLLTEH